MVVQWLRLRLPMQEIQVQSLVEELRSHVPPDQKTQNIKQKQYCVKFNKDFKKNGPHFKKSEKKKTRGYLQTSITFSGQVGETSPHPMRILTNTRRY